MIREVSTGVQDSNILDHGRGLSREQEIVHPGVSYASVALISKLDRGEEKIHGLQVSKLHEMM